MFKRSHSSRNRSPASQNAYDKEVYKLQEWFSKHVTLDGKPYTLDLDQTKAVLDAHKNTLVTARAGSGKTRVIVAKIAYLIACKNYQIPEIAAFMFNRTAAAEVNERIGAVRVCGKTLTEMSSLPASSKPQIASTFHKYALDLLKSVGDHPKIISENDQNQLINSALKKALKHLHIELPPTKYIEYFKHANNFVTRAGQEFLGGQGIKQLREKLEDFYRSKQNDPTFAEVLRIHRVCFLTYQNYLEFLKPPQTNFNLLIAKAAELLSNSTSSAVFPQVAKLKYLLVDEYQDFSRLFFSMIQAMRQNCPGSKLFAVGDDWQAINRFAGSNVSYFIDFTKYFTEESCNIPLVTNYRSAKSIVENANNYMLKNYDPAALSAVAFSHQKGRISKVNYQKIKFDATDLYEDALGDAVYQLALITTIQSHHQISFEAKNDLKKLLPIAKMLKSLTKIICKHRREQIMLLHRHNFTSVPVVTLEIFLQALQKILTEQNILTSQQFHKQVRCMTMHKSKGLESEVVILLEMNHDVVATSHPHANLFQVFGDDRPAELADRHRLLYVALTRAKKHLYILSSDQRPPV